MTFQDDINRMLTEGYERMERASLDASGAGLTVESLRKVHATLPPTITVSKSSAYLLLSLEQQLDAGFITEEQARAAGWTPPPPPSRRDRLRWRWQVWRERVGRRVGGWLAGVDLSERNEDW